MTRRRFPVGASPTRQPLQPEATGAVMEETKWLKPSVSVSRIGDSASVQAVTRVNAEQASKRTMRRPTRRPFRGRLIRLGEVERSSTPSRCAGVVATACTQGKRTQHGRPQGVVRDDQPDAREGQAGRRAAIFRTSAPTARTDRHHDLAKAAMRYQRNRTAAFSILPELDQSMNQGSFDRSGVGCRAPSSN